MTSGKWIVVAAMLVSLSLSCAKVGRPAAQMKTMASQKVVLPGLLDEWPELVGCMAGPGVEAASNCSDLDFDGDADVDLLDVHKFIVSGSLCSADADCRDGLICTRDACSEVGGCVHGDDECCGVICVERLTVDTAVLTVSGLDQQIVGVQLFIEYDPSQLAFMAIGPGPPYAVGGSPFQVALGGCTPLDAPDDTCVPTPGEIAYGAVTFTPVLADVQMATIMFTVLEPRGLDTVRFARLDHGYCVSGTCDGGVNHGQPCVNDFDCLNRPLTQLIKPTGGPLYVQPCE